MEQTYSTTDLANALGMKPKTLNMWHVRQIAPDLNGKRTTQGKERQYSLLDAMVIGTMEFLIRKQKMPASFAAQVAQACREPYSYIIDGMINNKSIERTFIIFRNTYEGPGLFRADRVGGVKKLLETQAKMVKEAVDAPCWMTIDLVALSHRISCVLNAEFARQVEL